VLGEVEIELRSPIVVARNLVIATQNLGAAQPPGSDAAGEVRKLLLQERLAPTKEEVACDLQTLHSSSLAAWLLTQNPQSDLLREFLQHGRMHPFGAAGFGMIDVVMQAARLTPAHRGSHDQLRDLCQVAQLDHVRVEQVVPVVAVDLVLDQLDAAKRALESPVAAHDADVVPHQAANLVPALRDHHALL